METLLRICHCCCLVSKLCPNLCNHMDYCMPGFAVLYQLPEFAQTHVPLSQWCHPTILSSVVPFSPCLQPFPASGSFPMSQFVTSGGQGTRVSASESVLPMNIFRTDFLYDWLVWSPCSPRDSQESSPTTVQKHQFFSAQLSLWSNSHIYTWLLEKP